MADPLHVSRDFITLSRRILHWANLGAPRLQFLREVSRVLLDYAGCDLLQIRCFGAELSYRWTLRRQPEESSTFEWVDDRTSPHGLDRIASALADSEIAASAPCITRRGSFWSNEAVEALAGFGAQRCLEAGQSLESIRSILLIPFVIQEAERAYLLLGSHQKDFFNHQAIELLETLAQILAQGIADRRSQAALRERVKELACLYRISQIKADLDRPMDEKLQQTVEQLPAAWQYPENAIARVTLDRQSFSTGAFEKTRFRQSALIEVTSQIRGCVEIGYTGSRPEFVEGPFLPEEQNLIDTIARELSLLVERSELYSRRAQLEEQLRHADRLAMIGKLASGVAHEINEPLESILGFAQLLQKEEMPEAQRKDLAKIITGGLHAREIVRKLVLFARQEPLNKSPVNLNEVIRESLAMLETKRAKTGARILLELDDDLPSIIADAVQLRQVVLNLVMNSLQAMPDGGELKLGTYYSANSVKLTVEDSGVGMSNEARKRLFTPFFTTKDVGEGTGLGLSVVHGIVSTHGGTIEVASEIGHGARFDVWLPVATAESHEKKGAGQHGR